MQPLTVLYRCIAHHVNVRDDLDSSSEAKVVHVLKMGLYE